MGLILLTAPTREPVTIDEARAVCRLLHTGADVIVTPLIAAGRERCERVSGRALISQQWKLTLPGWCDVIRLPKPPLISVDLIQYAHATTGVMTTLAADQYRVDSSTEPATITRAYNVTWPSYRAQTGAIEITFTAGYGDEAGEVPQAIREAIKNYVAYCFERPVERDERWLDTLFEAFFCGNYA